VIDAHSTLMDIAFEVCSELDREGITAVLVGGSAAQFYAPERYQSHDADFVITMQRDGSAGASVMKRLGFEAEDLLYVHPRSVFTVEFPPGPLSVGGDTVRSWETVFRGGRLLHVVSRTDCVRDRLAAWYFWGDGGSLYVACDVAKSGQVDMAAIRAWSAREGEETKFEEFVKLTNR
jgi:hypothetical protein